MVEYVPLHSGFLLLRNIGRIAHDDVVGILRRHVGEDILLAEKDIGVKAPCILLRHFERLVGDVDGGDSREAQIPAECHGYGSAACADVEHAQVGSLVLIHYHVNEFLRFLAWYQNIAVHLEIHAVEAGFAEDVLDRFSLDDSCDNPFDKRMDIRRYLTVAVDNDVGGVPSLQMMKNKTHHGIGLSLAVNRREPGLKICNRFRKIHRA